MDLITREEAVDFFNLELKNMPEEIECRFCGEDKQLVQPNKRIAFWVHRDLDVFEKCKILTFKTSFVRELAILWSHWIKIKNEGNKKIVRSED